MKNKALLIWLLSLSSYAFAGEYHGQSEVICSDCHTTHYSQRGTLPEGAEPGGPFSDLLLVGSVDQLCLSCHDGTDPAAPDVLAPVVMYSGSIPAISGAGYFEAPDGTISDYGHDLGLENQVPFSIPNRNAVLSCISCHDPHGTTNYRNLVLNPDSLGADWQVALGSDIFEENHPRIPPERAASINAYKASNSGYRSGMSRWCADCHTDLNPDNPGNPPAHFMRHPSDVAMNGSGYHINSVHWVAGQGDGFGLVPDDAIEGIPRLRFQEPGAADYDAAKTPEETNQVFCGTCHNAHGGPFKGSLTWPYKTDGSADLYSGCQQCHYK